MATYSFLSVVCSIAGPGGAFSLGSGSGNTEEGIDIEPTEDINTMTIGADGTPMHSLHGDRSGNVVVRLLKTSPVNNQLMLLYTLQTANPALHGQNIITLNDIHRGDIVTCQYVAFGKSPSLKYAKVGGMNEWKFHAGIITRLLGVGA